MLSNKNVLIGVTGGIAAYKVCDLINILKKANANIDVIMTNSACKFITPLTIESLINKKVYVDIFLNENENFISHINLAKKADIFVIVPATYNVIGKIANGIADDLLTSTVAAKTSKVIICPAMNTNMYLNSIFQDNIEKLKNKNFLFVEPKSGLLACGDEGIGKLADVQDIYVEIKRSFKIKDLKGKKIVITAGPTISNLDPVRYISNRSSGKMGYAIAEEAISRGADVILISGPTKLKTPKNCEFVSVETTEEMFEATGKVFDECDVLIKCAAPSDFSPETYSSTKIKKTLNAITDWNLKLKPNIDILEYYGNRKNKQIVVGFAAETNDSIKNASQKIIKKNLDFIVVNDVTKKGAGFNTDTNIVTIIDKESEIDYPILSKKDLSKIILDKVNDFFKNHGK